MTLEEQDQQTLLEELTKYTKTETYPKWNRNVVDHTTRHRELEEDGQVNDPFKAGNERFHFELASTFSHRLASSLLSGYALGVARPIRLPDPILHRDDGT